MPRCFSISIKSEVDAEMLIGLMAPATWMAPPIKKRLFIRVVFPASVFDIIPKVRRQLISVSSVVMLFMIVLSHTNVNVDHVGF